MRIAVQTLGTRGDVQPFLALAVGLRSEGHDVVFAAAPQFRSWVENHGIVFRELPPDLLDLMQTADGRAAVSGKLAIAAKLRLLRAVGPGMRRLLKGQREAANGAEAIVFHPKALGGRHIAEALRIPAFEALPLPVLTPTSAFPSPILPFVGLGPLNGLSHRLVASAPNVMFRRTIAAFRHELGLLSRRSKLPVTRLHAYSPEVVPPPPDFDPGSIVCGYWFLDEGADWTPPAPLAAFLAAGPPPVYVGFGSIPSSDPQAMTNLVVEALTPAGQRGVLAAGWGGMAERSLPPHVMMISEAPHDWLFPRMAAVVHHGGSGTVAAGLRAGRPTVICPIFGDQPFWARRLHGLGVSPAALPMRRLSPSALANAIRTATSDSGLTEKAKTVSETLRREQGVVKAISVIERGSLSGERAEPEPNGTCGRGGEGRGTDP